MFQCNLCRQFGFVGKKMEYIALKDVCRINMGQSPESTSYNESGNGIPFFQGNADFGERYPMTRIWCNAPTKVANAGDILISVRAPIGALNYAKEKCCIGRGLAAITPDSSRFSAEFIYWFLKGKNAELNTKGTGSTFKAIGRKVLEETLVPNYGFEQQNTCAANLEKVYSIIQMRRQELQKLDEIISARFVETFGDPITNPKGWDRYLLNDCLERIDSGKSFVCSDKPRVGNYPAVLKLSAATYGDYRPEENKALLDPNQFVEGAEVHSGDLLFTRKNTPELVGMAAYIQETPEKLMMPDLIFRLVTNDKMNPVFLWQLINCKEFRPIIQGISGGSAKSMSNISKERLGQINVICPPRQIQDQLVPFVHQVDKSKAVVQKSLDKMQLLFDSLMQQYFG